MNEREKARKNIIKHLAEMENENVLRSMCFVLGDYAVSEDGEKRANYITAILQNVILCTEIENLKEIYIVAKFCAEFETGKVA